MEDKNISKLDIEFYLLNREYADLSVDELKIINEHVASEQEFNEMKAVLMGVGDFFKKEKELEPNPAIKAALLREFNQQKPAGSYWLNGVFVSLFPQEKKIFQKPGVQLIGLAASVLLVVTFTFNLNNDINSTELAQNDEVISEQKIIEELEVSEKVKTIEPAQEKFASIETENIDNISEAESDNDVRSLLAEESEEEIIDGNETPGGGYLYDTDEVLPPSPEEGVLSSKVEDGYVNGDEIISAKDLAEFKKAKKRGDDSPVISDKLVLSGATAPTTGIVETVSAANTSMDIEMDDAEIDLPVNSRTLSEDADLIGILYTAM